MQRYFKVGDLGFLEANTNENTSFEDEEDDDNDNYKKEVVKTTFT